MSREAMKMALDALTLECCDNDGNPVDLNKPAIAALEAELAKPEQDCGEAGHTEGRCGNLSCLTGREQEPKLTDAGADTNITRGLEPKGSGMVTLNQVGMRVDLKDAPPCKEWVGLSVNEGCDFFESKLTRAELIVEISEFLEKKNGG